MVLLLMMFVSVGTSLSAVEASEMSGEMAMASDPASSVGGDCNRCPGGGDDGMPMACPSVCVVPILALLPENPTAVIAVEAWRLTAALPLPQGRHLLPDPYPPRSSDLL